MRTTTSTIAPESATAKFETPHENDQKYLALIMACLSDGGELYLYKAFKSTDNMASFDSKEEEQKALADTLSELSKNPAEKTLPSLFANFRRKGGCGYIKAAESLFENARSFPLYEQLIIGAVWSYICAEKDTDFRMSKNSEIQEWQPKWDADLTALISDNFFALQARSLFLAYHIQVALSASEKDHHELIKKLQSLSRTTSLEEIDELLEQLLALEQSSSGQAPPQLASVIKGLKSLKGKMSFSDHEKRSLENQKQQWKIEFEGRLTAILASKALQARALMEFDLDKKYIVGKYFKKNQKIKKKFNKLTEIEINKIVFLQLQKLSENKKLFDGSGYISKIYLKKPVTQKYKFSLAQAMMLYATPIAMKDFYGTKCSAQSTENEERKIAWEEDEQNFLHDLWNQGIKHIFDLPFQNKAEKFTQQLRSYAKENKNKNARLPYLHSREITANRLENIFTDPRYSSTEDVIRILSVEHAAAKAGTITAAIENHFDAMGIDNFTVSRVFPFDNLAVEGAKQLLLYVDDRERSITYKLGWKKTGYEDRLKLAGELAHELLLCKTDNELGDFMLKIKALKNDLETKNSFSDLEKILGVIHDNIAQRLNPSIKMAGDNNADQLFKQCVDKLRAVETNRLVAPNQYSKIGREELPENERGTRDDRKTRSAVKEEIMGKLKKERHTLKEELLGKLKVISENSKMDEETKCAEMRHVIAETATKIGQTKYGKRGFFGDKSPGSELRIALLGLQTMKIEQPNIEYVVDLAKEKDNGKDKDKDKDKSPSRKNRS